MMRVCFFTCFPVFFAVPARVTNVPEITVVRRYVQNGSSFDPYHPDEKLASKYAKSFSTALQEQQTARRNTGDHTWWFVVCGNDRDSQTSSELKQNKPRKTGNTGQFSLKIYFQSRQVGPTGRSV